MYGAHQTGAPIARPLFFAVPEDLQTWGIGDQFMLGTDILISPVLQAGQISVRPYFPKGVWYNLFDPSQVIRANNSIHALAAPLDTINVHVRSGAIIPMQDLAPSTTQARKTPFTLLIAMAPESDSCTAEAAVCNDVDFASGELFIDDDDQVQMEVKDGTATLVKFAAFRSNGRYVLKANVTEGAYALKQGLMLQTVSVLGVQSPPTVVMVNGKHAATKIEFNHGSSSLSITNLNLPIGISFEVAWECTSRGVLTS